ncbi:hypothetical protein STCU_01504 [Strigomonas culicis]|uniref:Ribosomal protein L1 n=1 Tax=Strigomonas culicis TaxID=28005 RepID=S9V0T0_9TRYP|nr:hypothetical protein STCU_05620 [Strigomonas culicis]EPY34598.1 hypothetical protein STCU_01504 [Strigomonas culicis]|eukprot:EPY27699.1 hypothetical protein STCU_05620 [Strigomonas culicis]
MMLPSIILSQAPELLHPTEPVLFSLPHNAYKPFRDTSQQQASGALTTVGGSSSSSSTPGRTTCLIIPRQISLDCNKINKRHYYYDAVITAEAICKRGDPESQKRAFKVAKTFTHFVVDSRIVGKLPLCLVEAVKTAPPATAAGGAATAARKIKSLLPLSALEDKTTLAYRLSEGSSGVTWGPSPFHAGQISIRVGHGGMTAGAICENAKHVIVSLKKEFPHVYKYVKEVKLVSAKTEPIRFMETQIQK